MFSPPQLYNGVVCRYFKENIYGASIFNLTRAMFWSDIYFARCRASDHVYTTKLMALLVIVVSAIVTIKLHFGTLELS